MKSYANRPLVVLGVNADPSPELLRQTQQKDHLPFRSWWDGVGGPIAQEWHVEGFPALYLIDHHGRIRLEIPGKPPTFEALDLQIERLVKDAERAAAK